MPLDLLRICTTTELSNLAGASLLHTHKGSGALTLSQGGHALLESIYPNCLPLLTRTYHVEAIRRRVRLAKLTLTAYRAGVDVFLLRPEDLRLPSSLYLPIVSRGRGANPWANTRTAAIAHLGDCSCAFHYVCPEIGKLLLAEELAVFSNNTAGLNAQRQIVFFAGESYSEIQQELERPVDPSSGRLISYGEAYRRLPLPVHLLCCDDTGAKQLRIMAQPDYRAKLTHAALKAQYRPPPENLPGCDALYDGHPFVMAADMDLRRMDAVCADTKEQGCPAPVMVALAEQASALINARYRDTGLARVFVLTDAALTQALGGDLNLYRPIRTQFTDAKGDVLNAPLVQAHSAVIQARGKR